MPLFGPPNIERMKTRKDIKKLLRTSINSKYDYTVSSAAIEAIVDISKPAIDPLIAALKNKDFEIRRKAAHALGKIGAVRACEPLISAINDCNSSVRWQVARSLGEIGDSRAVEPLIAAFMDESESVRSSASTALAKIGMPAFKSLAAAYGGGDGDLEIKRCIRDALTGIGIYNKPDVKQLMVAFKGKDETTHKAAARVLEGIGKPAIQPLVDVLKDEDESVRMTASFTLLMIGSQTIQPLIIALKDENEVLRNNAAYTLEYMGKSRRFKDPIERALRAEYWDADEDLQNTINHILKKISDHPAPKKLDTHLAPTESTEVGIEEQIRQTLESLQPDIRRAMAARDRAERDEWIRQGRPGEGQRNNCGMCNAGLAEYRCKECGAEYCKDCLEKNAPSNAQGGKSCPKCFKKGKEGLFGRIFS